MLRMMRLRRLGRPEVVVSRVMCWAQSIYSDITSKLNLGLLVAFMVSLHCVLALVLCTDLAHESTYSFVSVDYLSGKHIPLGM